MLGGLGVILLILVVYGAFTVSSLLSIRSSAEKARANLGEAITLLAQGEVEPGLELIRSASAQVEDALQRSRGMDLRLARSVPFLGREVRVVQASTEAAADVIAGVEVVADHLALPHSAIYRAGSIDPGAAVEFAVVWEEASDLMNRAAARMEGAEEPRMAEIAVRSEEVAQRALEGAIVAEAMHSLLSRIATAGSGSSPVQIMVVFTNGAELRGMGGVPVFLARFEVSDHIELSDLTSTSVAHPAQAVEAPDRFLELFGEYLTSRLWSNLTMSPDGPTVGEVGATMYEEVAGVRPDLVLVTDLVAAGYLLGAFPGIELDGTEFDPRTLATDFLIDSYREFPDGADQNDYLLEVFDEVFGQLLGIDPRGGELMTGLRRAVGEGRVTAWSPDPALQAGLELAGADRLLGEEEGRVDVGVQNFGGNKLDLFTTVDADLEFDSVGCAVVGRLEVSVSEATPADVLDILSYGSDSNRWWVNVYLPPEAHLQQLYANAQPSTGGGGTWGEREVGSVFVEAPIGGIGTAGVEWLAPIPESGTMTVNLPATVSGPARQLVYEVPAVDGCG